VDPRNTVQRASLPQRKKCKRKQRASVQQKQQLSMPKGKSPIVAPAGSAKPAVQPQRIAPPSKQVHLAMPPAKGALPVIGKAVVPSSTPCDKSQQKPTPTPQRQIIPAKQQHDVPKHEPSQHKAVITPTSTPCTQSPTIKKVVITPTSTPCPSSTSAAMQTISSSSAPAPYSASLATSTTLSHPPAPTAAKHRIPSYATIPDICPSGKVLYEIQGTAESCGQICAKTNRCVGFSLDHTKNICKLLASFDSYKLAQGQSTAYVRVASETYDLNSGYVMKKYIELKDLSFGGSTYRFIKDGNFMKCSSECAKDAKCRGFSESAGLGCHLVAEINSGYASPGWTSHLVLSN
jgi:hypothetical protein